MKKLEPCSTLLLLYVYSVHIPSVSSRGASEPANAGKAFGFPATIQLAHDGRINVLAPLRNALVVLIQQAMSFLSVLL